MLRFFFDYSHDGATTRDELGVELSSIEDVRSAALIALAEYFRDLAPFHPVQQLSISVRDQTDEPVFTLSLTLTPTWGYAGSVMVVQQGQ